MNSSSKKKLYIGLLLLLFAFLLQFILGKFWAIYRVGTNIPFIILLSIIGIFIAYRRRIKSRDSSSDKSLVAIIVNDYSLSSYASLSLLSLIYTILQGALLGSTLGFIVTAISYSGEGDVFLLNLGLGGLSILFVVVVRIMIEGISLVFRVAEDISRSVK